MPKVIVVWNQTGGVGKTTISINLACQLAQAASVCLVDGDTSASAMEWVDEGHLPISAKWLPLMYRGMPSCRLPNFEKYRSLILAWYEGAKVIGHSALRPAVSSVGFVTEFEAWEQRVAAISSDMVVIDLPSEPQMTSIAALTSADLIVVPVAQSYETTQNPVAWLRKMLAGKAHRSAPVLLLWSNPTQGRADRSEVKAALHRTGELVGNSINYQATFRASAQVHEWVGSYAPQSAAHKEIAALAEEVMHLLAKGSSESDRRGHSG